MSSLEQRFPDQDTEYPNEESYAEAEVQLSGTPKELYEIKEDFENVKVVSTEYHDRELDMYKASVESFSEESVKELLTEVEDEYYYSHLDRCVNREDEHRDSGSMTEKQQNLLEIAYEEGYFEAPREIDQKGLAEHPETSCSSKTSISQVVRRGTSSLIADHFELKSQIFEDVGAEIHIGKSPKNLYNIDNFKVISTEYDQSQDTYTVNIESSRDSSIRDALNSIPEEYDPETNDLIHPEGEMTKKWQDVLDTAYKAGHFEVPSRISQVMLAESITDQHPRIEKISKPGISRLIRKGTSELIEEFLEPRN